MEITVTKYNLPHREIEMTFRKTNKNIELVSEGVRSDVVFAFFRLINCKTTIKTLTMTLIMIIWHSLFKITSETKESRFLRVGLKIMSLISEYGYDHLHGTLN